MTNPTNALAQIEKDRKPRWWNLFLALIAALIFALVLAILAPFLIPSPSAADLSNGCFKIKAVGYEEQFTGIAGSKTCGEAPVIPSIPTPELAVAGVCAAPNAENKIFALTTTGIIREYTLNPDGRGFTGPVTVSSTGVSGANSLGLTPQGEFFFSAGTGALYAHKPGESVRQISPTSTPTTPVAGASMVYKGVSEYYVGTMVMVSGNTAAELTVYRHSPTADRNGLIFTTRIDGAPGANGDFTFAPNGDLTVVAGGENNRMASVPFARFADLKAGTAAQIEATTSGLTIYSGGTNGVNGAVNGVAMIGSTPIVSSTTSMAAFQALDSGYFPSSLIARFPNPGVDRVTDLATCQIS